MNFALLLIVHWLHILAGIVWVGGYIFMTFALWPALLRRPPAEARATLDTMGPAVGLLMMIAGSLVTLLGIVRGTWLGPLKSVGVVFSSAYGLTWLVALLLTIALSAYGARSGRSMAERVWDGDQLRPGAAQYVRSSSALSLVGFGVVLACMVLMRFGL
jgi:uncharacterized membrane protein